MDYALIFFIKFIIEINNNFYIFLKVINHAFIIYKFIFSSFRNIY